MIVPKSDFRPNPDRAIFVQGEINLDLVQDLIPQIIYLQNQSREPITVFIDSPGGSVGAMLALLKLLRSKSQDYQEKCRLITVVTRMAASAAADLLSAGDYALAYPDSEILFHGGRIPEQHPLTAERTSLLAQVLRRTNEFSAMELAREIEFRFMFRFITAQSSFQEIRDAQTEPEMSELDCFLHYMRSQLSSSAKKIFDKAKDRYSRYNNLLETVIEKTKSVDGELPTLELEAIQIKAIVDFEVQQNSDNPGWSFRFGGSHSLIDDFLLFAEYESMAESPRFIEWCSRYGGFMLTAEENKKLSLIEDLKVRATEMVSKVSPVLQPVWSFFVALCYTLQQDEDEFLTAQDTYWLGLIDEVIGEVDLPPLRLIYETKDDKDDTVKSPDSKPAKEKRKAKTKPKPEAKTAKKV